MSSFDAFGILRAIRDDKAITTTEKMLLTAAVLRADKGTGKVRASVSLLADDAGTSRKWATLAFQKSSVLRYFATVERKPRKVDLTFHPSACELSTRAEEDPAVEAWCAAVQAKHEREKADRMAAASAHGYWLEDSDPAGLASAAAEQARESRLNAEQETPMGRLIAEAKAAGKPVDPTGLPLMLLLGEVQALMQERHRKYGPGNIAEFGPLGILVRMADKFARLKAGHENFSDETVANTLDDIIGYAAIWKLWLSGDWPGSDGR